ncbi:MAG: YdcF family protein [Hydrococcus sp. Prado102]|jgi:uncharacterized SAM-binding protein YcdF (DUF218 family)|nr:YdcF family protein [Hydrococcus sp. Prado102]
MSLLGWVAIVFAVFTSIIPLRIAIARYQEPKPKAILILGGNFIRFHYGAEFAKNYPELDIWVSDFPSQYKFYKRLFQQRGVAAERIYYDDCATDTVTNFTCMVRVLQERDLRHIYLVTSDYHMARASAIATLILGSQGIIFTPISVPSEASHADESKSKIIRDCIRSLVWLFTGYSGAGFNPNIQKFSR